MYYVRCARLFFEVAYKIEKKLGIVLMMIPERSSCFFFSIIYICMYVYICVFIDIFVLYINIFVCVYITTFQISIHSFQHSTTIDT